MQNRKYFGYQSENDLTKNFEISVVMENKLKAAIIIIDSLKDVVKHHMEHEEGLFLDKLVWYWEEFANQDQQIMLCEMVGKPFFEALCMVLAKSQQESSTKIIYILKLISLSASSDKIMEILSSGVPEALIRLVSVTEESPGNEHKVAEIFKILANLYDCRIGDCKSFIETQLDQLLKVVVGWKCSDEVPKSFVRFLCALVSAEYHLLRSILTPEYIQICVEVAKNGIYDTVNELNSQSLLDFWSVFVFLTDIRKGDDERLFAPTMFHFINKGIYEYSFKILLGDTAFELKVLAARLIGSASSTENFPKINEVSLVDQGIAKLIKPIRCRGHKKPLQDSRKPR